MKQRNLMVLTLSCALLIIIELGVSIIYSDYIYNPAKGLISINVASQSYNDPNWEPGMENPTSSQNAANLKLHRKVEQLSGGERQRVAIARAIVCDQPIILADEPTGSLDAVNRDRVMDILMDLCNEKGKTLIIVTHDTSVAERCDRIIRMKDGQITDRAGE